MGFYRIYPTQDTWISNKITGTSPTIRATGSNHGASPNINIFAFDDTLSGNVEWARGLVKFDITDLSGKIFDEKTIPSSSVTYRLKMFDAKHGLEVPTSYDLFVFPLSRSWDEGTGIDDENFKDSGYANWNSASSTQVWTNTGSDFLTENYGSASQHFDRGQEDLDVTLTEVVGNWLSWSIDSAGIPNHGLVVKLGDTEENNGTQYRYKKFHTRETKFVDRMPYIEARWDDVRKDNRGNFGFDVTSSLYMYNFIRGELTSVAEPVTVTVRDHVKSVSASYTQQFSAAQIEPGVLTASMVIKSTGSFSSSFVDIWSSASIAYFTGSFMPLVLTGSGVDQYDEFDVSITNLKHRYSIDEEARLKVHVRKRNYRTHRGFVPSGSLSVMEKEFIEKMYYSIINEHSKETVVPFGTGSVPFTQLSYNQDGNYFNLDMQSFIPGFSYRILFLIDINKHDKKLIDEEFIFRVV